MEPLFNSRPSNTKITRQLAGIRPSANTKKPQRAQKKIKKIIIFFFVNFLPAS